MLIQKTQPEQNNTKIWLSFHNKPDHFDVQQYQIIKPEHFHTKHYINFAHKQSYLTNSQDSYQRYVWKTVRKSVLYPSLVGNKVIFNVKTTAVGRSGLERSYHKRKVGCSNPSRDRPK